MTILIGVPAEATPGERRLLRVIVTSSRVAIVPGYGMTIAHVKALGT
jgi:NAD/NADP transhydrogenase beta subunit